MKAVILAGGRGTRLTEETELRPKPMVEIGGRPILWHIMKLYAHFGIRDFVLCLGYKGYIIKEYFANYLLHNADVIVDIGSNRVEFHGNRAEPWRVTMVDTGDNTMTGGRLKRVRHHLDPAEPFCMTYGDGIADLDICELVAFHRAGGRLATLTAVPAPSRFGAIDVRDDRIERFREKPEGEGAYINGGFFVLSPKVLEYVEGDDAVWERDPLERLAAAGELRAFRHTGFWQPMDTMRDKDVLQSLWAHGRAPWKLWE